MTIVLTYRYTTMRKWPPAELSSTRNRGLSVKKERKNAPVASMISVLPKHRKLNADGGRIHVDQKLDGDTRTS